MNNHVHRRSTTFVTRGALVGVATGALLLATTACEEEDGSATIDLGDDVSPVVDADVLRSALLVPDDLRGGWAEDFDQGDDLLSAGCLGVDVSADSSMVGRAARLGENDGEIEHRVLVFDSDEGSRGHLDDFGDDTARDCFADAVRRRAVDNGSDGDVTMERFDIESYDPGWASDVEGVDAVAGYRAVVGMEAYDVSFDLHVDVVAVRAGRTVSLVSFSEIGEPLPGDVQRDAVDAVIERLRRDGIA